MNAERLLAHYERIADAPDAIAKMRRFVLDLAVHGKLVPQESTDEPASDLLKRTTSEKTLLTKAGSSFRGDQRLLPIGGDAAAFDIPMKWCWARLGMVASYIQRGKSPKYAASDGSLVVSQRCVQWRGLDLTVAKRVTLESLAEYEPDRFLRDGDLLWNSTGTGTIGRVLRLVDTPARLVCDSHVTVVRCMNMNAEYVRIWLRCDYVYGVIEDRAAGSTNQIELTAQMAVNQMIPVPPFYEQDRIVAKVDELMGLCDRIEVARSERETTRDRLATASYACLNAVDTATFYAGARFMLRALPELTARSDQINQLRRIILNLAVRGKLVPQDPKDEPAATSLEQILADRRNRADKYMSSEREVGQFDIPATWAWASTFEVCECVENGNTPPAAEMAGAGEIPFIKVYNLTKNGNLDFSVKPTFINRKTHEKQLARSRIFPGDVLMNIVGPPLGKVSVVPDTYPEWNTNQAVVLLRASPKLLPKYLAICLMSNDVLSWILDLAQQTVGQVNISVGKARRLPIPYPPFPEQQRIVAKLDELMALCDRIEASLTNGERTRGRLLDALLREALLPVEDILRGQPERVAENV